jgi:general secretion pathway protein G
MEAGTVTGKRKFHGFTLIELLVVLALISLLAAMVAPMVGKSVPRAKESALRENLFVLRKTLDDYYADKGRYPATLQQLVDERYVRKIPVDPITSSDWGLVYSDAEPRGIVDLHSNAKAVASDGTIYESW